MLDDSLYSRKRELATQLEDARSRIVQLDARIDQKHNRDVMGRLLKQRSDLGELFVDTLRTLDTLRKARR